MIRTRATFSNSFCRALEDVSFWLHDVSLLRWGEVSFAEPGFIAGYAPPKSGGAAGCRADIRCTLLGTLR